MVWSQGLAFRLGPKQYKFERKEKIWDYNKKEKC